MSLRGLKKALYRTPHRLFGKESEDSATVKAWQHDIETAIAGLDFIKLEAKKWKQYWIDSATTLSHILGILADVHGPLRVGEDEAIEDDEEEEEEGHVNDEQPKLERRTSFKQTLGIPVSLSSVFGVKSNKGSVSKDEQFAYITHHELREAKRASKIIYEGIQEIVDEQYKSISTRCDAMKDNLKEVLKLISKRNHKKMDYDMSVNIVEKAVVSKGSSDANKDITHLNHSQTKMEQAKQIYENLDVKVRTVLPPVLEVLSEFLSKLTMKVYFSNVKTMKHLEASTRRFSESQGLLGAGDGNLSYEMIMNEFLSAYSTGQDKLETLDLLQQYRTLRQKNLKDKTIKGVGSAATGVARAAVDVTGTVYHKTTKSGQKVSLRNLKIENPVKAYQGETGIFSTATDPIEFQLRSMQDEENKLLSETASLKSPEESTTSSSVKDESLANESVVSMKSSSTKPADDGDWLKPLSLNKTASVSPNTDKFSEKDVSSQMSTSTSIENASTEAHKTTETAKYTSVKLGEIRARIKTVFTTPEISRAPVTLDPQAYKHAVHECEPFIKASSSISAAMIRANQSTAPAN